MTKTDVYSQSNSGHWRLLIAKFRSLTFSYNQILATYIRNQTVAAPLFEMRHKSMPPRVTWSIRAYLPNDMLESFHQSRPEICRNNPKNSKIDIKKCRNFVNVGTLILNMFYFHFELIHRILVKSLPLSDQTHIYNFIFCSKFKTAYHTVKLALK